MNEDIVTADAADSSTVDDSTINATGKESLQVGESVEQPAQEIDPHEDKIQKRIDKAVYEKHQARREAEQAKREIEELRRQYVQPSDDGYAAPTADEVYNLVKQEASRLRAEETYNESCNRVYDAGKQEFGEGFDKAMQNLSLVGMSRDFLELVSTSDNGAKILAHLGGDIDEAERFASMQPMQMAREIGKLDIKLGSTAAPKAKAVSKAPAPITPVGGKSGGTKSTYEMSDAEYAAWRKQT